MLERLIADKLKSIVWVNLLPEVAPLTRSQINVFSWKGFTPTTTVSNQSRVSVQCGLSSGYLDWFDEKMHCNKCHKQMVFLQCGYSGGRHECFNAQKLSHMHKQNCFLQCGHANGLIRWPVPENTFPLVSLLGIAAAHVCYGRNANCISLWPSKGRRRVTNCIVSSNRE